MLTQIVKLEKNLEKIRNSLSTDRLDMSYGEIINMYDRGELIIDPEFQRLFRWDIYQRTRLIESILIGIPIPPIFVAENKEGKWELVDGLQRVSTIISFFGQLKLDPKGNNNWELAEGDLIKEFSGLRCSQLPMKFHLNIKRASCRVEIIKWNSGFDMRYELFNRLNTGGSELTDQEIRNCIFRGTSDKFNLFLSSSAKNPIFLKLIEPTEKQLQELYVDELVLRFCALFDASEMEDVSVSENLSNYMTTFMRDTAANEVKIQKFEQLFGRILCLLNGIDSSIFRGKNSAFSPSIFDCVMVGVATHIDKYEGKPNPQELIMKKKQDLIITSAFASASGSGTSSSTRVNKRINLATAKFDL